VPRTVAGTVNALVAAYLDRLPTSTSPFKTFEAETQRTRRNILENFRNVHGDKPGNLEPSLCKPSLRFPGNANFKARDQIRRFLLSLGKSPRLCDCVVGLGEVEVSS
jgi:hypothetical protein